MANLGDYVRTLDVPEPLRAPAFPAPVKEPIEAPEREAVPVRRKAQ